MRKQIAICWLALTGDVDVVAYFLKNSFCYSLYLYVLLQDQPPPAYKHSLKELVGCGYGQNESTLYKILDSLKLNSMIKNYDNKSSVNLLN